MDRYDLSTGACCLVGEDAQERAPSGILDALGKMVVLEHVGRLQVFVIDGVVLAHEGERRLMAKVPSLALHLLMRSRYSSWSSGPSWITSERHFKRHGRLRPLGS